MVEARFALSEATDPPVVLASLAAQPVPSSFRGGQEIFRGLFVRPFGPRALAAYQAERRRTPEPVYGLSREDTARMRLLLEQLNASERLQRRTMAGINLAMAGVYGTCFGLAQGTSGLKRDERVGLLVGGVLLTGFNLGAGRYRLLSVSERERSCDDFRGQMAKPGADQARIAATIEERLVRIQAEEQRRRKWALVGGYISVGLLSGIVVLNELSADQTREYRMLERGFLLGVGGMILGLTLKEQFSTSPTDKFIELWRKDPRHLNLNLAAVPIPGGGMVGISGQY